MNFLNKDQDASLKIAWNAGTLGVHGRGKRMLKKSIIVSFNVPKLCKLVSNEQCIISLGTKACLLYGASTIMRQQSNILYEDTVQLCKKLKAGLTRPEVKQDINMEKPFASENVITLLEECDDLLVFKRSTNAPSFSDLFDDHGAYSNQQHYDVHSFETNLSPLLRLSSMHIDESNSGLFQMLRDSTMEQPAMFQLQGMANQQDDRIDFGFDMDYNDPIHDESQDVTGALEENNENNKQGFPLSTEAYDTIFDLPHASNDILLAKSITAHSPLNKATLSPHHSSSSHSPATSGRNRNPSVNSPPPLIREEDEESIASMNTELYASLVPENHPDRIVVSPTPPTLDRPRAVKRMMLSRAQDTVLSFDEYQATDRILTNKVPHTEQHKDRLNVRHLIRYPSMITVEKGVGIARQVEALFNSNRIYDRDQIEFGRTVEKSRRFDRRRDGLNSWSHSPSTSFISAYQSGGISVRSTSDVHTPELHNINLDLGEEANMNLLQENHQVGWQFDDQQISYGDNMEIDYEFLDFNGHQLNLEETEEQTNQFFDELKSFGTQQRIQLNHLFQYKTQSEIAKIFSHVLELATKGKIRTYQPEPYDSIDIELIHI